jgi:hypothetical protein
MSSSGVCCVMKQRNQVMSSHMLILSLSARSAQAKHAHEVRLVTMETLLLRGEGLRGATAK